MIEELIQAAQTEVDNHSIYVWGGAPASSVVKCLKNGEFKGVSVCFQFI